MQAKLINSTQRIPLIRSCCIFNHVYKKKKKIADHTHSCDEYTWDASLHIQLCYQNKFIIFVHNSINVLYYAVIMCGTI